MKYHTPVLVNQINCLINPSPGKIIIDATLGNGGHTINFLKYKTKVYGIDKDKHNLKIAIDRINQLNLSNNFTGILDDFKNIYQIHLKKIKTPVDAILFDLGLSINQQKSKNRGFSFNDDKSLDMRLNPVNQKLTAEIIINTYTQEQLFNIFSKYGQEIHSHLIAQSIINTRKHQPFTSTKSLSDFIFNLYQTHHLSFSKIHPATKILLALKITVNNELDNLKTALNDCLKIIKPSCWIIVITFHSSEDRLVKDFIKIGKKSGKISKSIKIKPSYRQTVKNPLCRSSILRAFRK